MRTYKTGTQKARILGLLRGGPVCSSRMYWSEGVTHRLAARICEMREDGLVIETRICQHGSHDHSSGMVEYVLKRGTV